MSQPKEGNFLFLLIGLMTTLLVGPISVEFIDQSPGLIVSFAFTATLVFGIWSLVESKKWFRIGVLLALADVIVTVADAFWPQPGLQLASMVIGVIFCSFSVVFALGHVFKGNRIDGNRIIGAVCVYLLLGVTLALLNIMVYQLVPDSFNGLAETAEAEQGLDLIYYSFVTMTTLGYGDIAPAGPLAKALAYFGAITGQFYIAILVGMAVGQYLGQRRASDLNSD
jgi:voltage-gated potassium channel